jgi:hypothetical protein
MRSETLKYSALGLLAIIISFNALQVWHNGWAHVVECSSTEKAQHLSEEADCLLCHLYFSATSTALQVLNIIVASTVFVVATWQPNLTKYTPILGQPLRGPPAFMA